MDIAGQIGLAILLFAATNIDDILILLGFFADRTFRAGSVVAGQYLGIAMLVAVSAVASLISLVIAPTYIGLLGVAPVLIGAKKLYDVWRGEDADEASLEAHSGVAGYGQAIAVALVTIANGGDNIGIYTPVFATSSVAEIVTIVIVFAVMTGVWLGFAHWLVNHPNFGAPIRRYGHIAAPIVLILLGVFILWEAGSLSLLA